MNGCQSLYNNASFWQEQLENGRVWQGVFSPEVHTRFPLFVNSIITDRPRGIASCDWASYPSAHAFLGFMQYVYMPTVFYTLLRPDLSQLHTPIGPTEELKKMLLQQDDERTGMMAYFLNTTASLWPLCEYRLTKALFDFCNMFPHAFGTGQNTFRVDMYASAPAISCRMQQEYWCGEVFEEDTGMDLHTLSAVCAMAQDEPLYQALLVEFLNTRSVALI